MSNVQTSLVITWRMSISAMRFAIQPYGPVDGGISDELEFYINLEVFEAVTDQSRMERMHP
jgi:hypothetical protein